MIIPPKLKPGDEVRIIAPSCTLPSLGWMDEAFLERAKDYFRSRGCTVSESKHLRERNVFDSTSIQHRIEDLHEAFRDPKVTLMCTIRGGWNCNQLLPHLDYTIIKNNPKIFCGFSDITALANGIHAKTGLVTYSGANFYHFGFGSQMQYTYDAFDRCVMQEEPFEIVPSTHWTSDRYEPAHPELTFKQSEGFWILQEGKAEGVSLGANLCTLQLLHGTEFMPDIRESILFLEDDYESHPRTFDRDFESLTKQPGFDQIRGILIGRFEPCTANGITPMDRVQLEQIVASKSLPKGIPVIANVDFGHTNPIITFPIGGTVRMEAGKGTARIEILVH
ncbi:LD-carboxypeptidase [Candidatus Peribacteria bacterium]|nr:LD-carboxypeptidase [Candidatus Peribacteria bacterium]